jgi:hypothetical protein
VKRPADDAGGDGRGRDADGDGRGRSARGLVVDAARAEVSGPDEAIRELLADAGPVELEPRLLADGVRAARAPVARFRVTGLEEPLEAVADLRAGALLLPRPGGVTALRACSPSGLLGLLVRAVGLRPRPRVTAEPLTLPVDRMARLLVGAEDAEAPLREHLAARVAHWRIEAYGPGAGWYLEVLDSELGLWTLEQEERRITLAPTDATAVLDQLAALPGRVGLGPS